jgi:hypothetical protein
METYVLQTIIERAKADKLDQKLHSAFSVSCSPGWIFVEGSGERDIRQAFAGISGVMRSPVELVPPNDSIALLTINTGNIRVKEGMWVRVK